jgi:hypothetical protein
MTLDRRAYIRAVYPPPMRMPGESVTVVVPADFRRFTLHWNSRKAKGSRRRADEWQECAGVLFPAGSLVRVALGNGTTFPTQSEMEHVLELGGDYRIEWLDNA